MKSKQQQVRSIQRILNKPKKKDDFTNHFSVLDKLESIERWEIYKDTPFELSDFVKSVRKFYEDNDFLTHNQLAAIDAIIYKNEIPLEAIND